MAVNIFGRIVSARIRSRAAKRKNPSSCRRRFADLEFLWLEASTVAESIKLSILLGSLSAYECPELPPELSHVLTRYPEERLTTTNHLMVYFTEIAVFTNVSDQGLYLSDV